MRFAASSTRRINYSYECNCHYMDLCDGRCPDRDLRARPDLYFIKKYEKEQRGNERSSGSYQSRSKDFVCGRNLRKDRQDQERCDRCRS